MESLKFQNIKLEKANAILRYKKCQRVTMLFRFIEYCIFFVIISRFSPQFPLDFNLSTEYFKGLGVTLVSPRFVFVLVNAIVIILFLKSGHSSTKDGSTSNVKIDLYDEYEKKYSMNKETYCEQGKIQRKQSIAAERRVAKPIHHSHSDNSICSSHDEKKQRKQSIVAERRVEKPIHRIHSDNSLCSPHDEKKQRKQSMVAVMLVEKPIHRSHSGSSLCLSHDEKKPRKKMIRSATVGCLKVINTDSVKSTRMAMTRTSYPEDGMSSDEFRKTVEAFIARQQRLLREEEFSDVVSL